MIEIIFQKTRDAKKMYEHITNQLNSNALESGQLLLSKDKRKIQIFDKNMPNKAFHMIKTGVYEYIAENKRDDWFKEILTKGFFYTDPSEQEQILEIIHSMIEGNRDDLVSFLSGPDEEEYVQQAIDEMFNENVSFSFDSFVMFRLKPFHDRLRSYVEVAIDEYKLEQEYQTFVQTLRDFLSRRESQRETIHVMINEETTFFDQGLKEIKRSELLKGIDRRLLGNHPIYVDSVTIAPLLTIAPEKIYLYTNQPEQPLVRTIGNIFEERVNIYPLKVFYENRQSNNEKVQ